MSEFPPFLEATMPLCVLIVILLLGFVACSGAAPVVTDLRAEFRDGQVFLTWQEIGDFDGSLTVLCADEPITAENVGEARAIAQFISPKSANDWWLNPETYGNPMPVDPATGQKPAAPRDGFLIASGGERLDPDSGLHVHTVTADDPARAYYAVVSVARDGEENRGIIEGGNSLTEPVAQRVQPVRPIWQNGGAELDTSAGQGKPLHLILHAKTGKGGMDYLVFGDASLGWREGLPFKFGVRVTDQAVIVSPTDRTWIDRMFPEGRDGCQRLTPAIHSFWYGYNDQIRTPERMAEGTVINFTERRLLWILDWAQRTFGTDANRVYAYGSSMGGCGALSFCLRHPEIFAGIRAHVPIVAYDRGPRGDSTVRVEAETGGMEMPTNEGLTVKDRLDAVRFVKGHPGDLPFLVITNGRRDASIPWWKNPDFYRAMRDGRHGMVAAWDDGTHSTCGAENPPDIKAWNNLAQFHALIALNKSYPAFSNCSEDGDPGNGDAADGDLVGYFGRGLAWEEPTDTEARYKVRVKWTLAPEQLPVTVDVTPRRVQRFRLAPGQKVSARVTDAATGEVIQGAQLTADASGRVTFTGLRISGPAGVELVLSRD